MRAYRLTTSVAAYGALAIAFLMLMTWLQVHPPFPEPHPLPLGDFRKGYYAAGEAILHHGPSALLPLILKLYFVNWPIVSFLFVPFAVLHHRLGELSFYLLSFAAIGYTYVLLTRGCTTRQKFLVLFLFLLNGPLWYCVFSCGNTTHFVLLALTCALRCLQTRRFYAAGALIGLAAIIKPMIMLFVVYFISRRLGRAALAGAGIVAATALSSVAVFGMDFTRHWYMRCIVELSRNPIGAFNNQSFEAFLLRLWSGPTYMYDYDYGHALPHPLMLLAKLLPPLLLALSAWTAWQWRRTMPWTDIRGFGSADAVDFSLLIAFCVVTSPVSWTHYFLLLLLPWSLYLTGRLPLPGGPATKILFWTSVILCSLPVFYPGALMTGRLAPIWTRTIVSPWLCGGLLFLLTLCRSYLRATQTDRPEDMVGTIDETAETGLAP
ncbi:glycosyltransferase family 87 protein [Nguyenibacter sp. L1]|uniref:glycosyltransferase family 87 protein n=1 Tax=Nguyenibacter sp. L1 TaxID=3049350 RepID=UPI002B4689C7|nr:glycosyltransferase family 87 protein [Nguyenibacter sp. L1]WRH89420.1 glycosyltransferase family 87 protein [Nguyenibacter sp. L1]